MSTTSITQAGIDPRLINQRMNELTQQPQSKPNIGKDDATETTDTVKITANISEKPALEFEAIDEEQANILAQLVAGDLSKQSHGLSSQAGTEALRAFI
jgi:hypothetical protein